jgi:hypothetical protein
VQIENPITALMVIFAHHDLVYFVGRGVIGAEKRNMVMNAWK